MIPFSVVLVIAGFWQGAGPRRPSADLPNLVLEPFPGYVSFLQKESFKMNQPDLFGQWRCPDSDLLTVQIGPGYGVTVMRGPQPFFEKGVRLTNGANESLTKMDAQVGACGGYELGAIVYTAAGPMRLKLKYAMLETPQYEDRYKSDPSRMVATAKPGKLELLAKGAKHIMDSLHDPRWFEAFQADASYLSPLGLKPFVPQEARDRRNTPDWSRDSIVLRFEFGPVSRNQGLLDAEGNLHLNVALGSTPIANPELEKAGIKTIYLAALVAGFRAGNMVYVLRYGGTDRKKWPLAYPPAGIPRGERMRPQEFDAKILASFNRVVLGLKKLAAARPA